MRSLLIAVHPSFGRTSQRTGRNGVRCWCLAGTSSCWSSASGTSLSPERGQTSTSSDPTSWGWVAAQTVHLTISGPVWAKMSDVCQIKYIKLFSSASVQHNFNAWYLHMSTTGSRQLTTGHVLRWKGSHSFWLLSSLFFLFSHLIRFPPGHMLFFCGHYWTTFMTHNALLTWAITICAFFSFTCLREDPIGKAVAHDCRLAPSLKWNQSQPWY